MRRKESSSSDGQKENGRLTLALSLIATVLSVVATMVTISAYIEDRSRTSADRRIAVRTHLDKAANYLNGGKEGSDIIYGQADDSDLQMASSEIAAALDLDPYNARGLRLKGVYLTSARRAEDAIKVLDESLRADPKEAKTYISLGNAYQKIGRLDEAESAYQKALAVGPESRRERSMIFHNLALVYRGQGKHDRVVEAYNKSYENDSGSAYELNNLGEYYLSVDDYQGAIKAFKRAQEADNSSYESYQNLGLVLLARGRFQEAEQALRESLLRSPGNEKSLIGIGDALLARNALRRAESYYREAKSRHPGSSEANERLAMIYMRKEALDDNGARREAGPRPQYLGVESKVVPIQSYGRIGLPAPDLDVDLENAIFSQREKYILSGIVTNSVGKPLRGISVRVFHEAREAEEGMMWVDEASTDVMGRYAIELERGTPLLIIFSDPQEGQVKIARRSAKEADVELSFIMQTSQDRSSDQIKREQVEAIETFWAASRVAPPAKAKEMDSELRVIIDKVDPPGDLVKKVSEILEDLTLKESRPSPPPLELPRQGGGGEPPKGPLTVWVISDEPPGR